jgi:hypothetical protein
MSEVAQPDAPVSIPFFVHPILWAALAGWTLFLIRRRRRRAWPCFARFGASLVPACLLTDAAALAAAIRWPTPESDSFVFAVVWLAVLFSITSYIALRTPGDGGGGGDGPDADEPEPPWWPHFEREFRDYARGGPRGPAERPRTPSGLF